METRNARSVLILNGGVVLFVGLLVGVGYGASIIDGAAPDVIDNWRITHVQNVQNGMLMLLIAACLPLLSLPRRMRDALIGIAIGAAYCDMIAWFVRTATGHTGLEPSLPAANLVVFALLGLTAAGQFAAIGLFVLGGVRGYRLKSLDA